MTLLLSKFQFLLDLRELRGIDGVGCLRGRTLVLLLLLQMLPLGFMQFFPELLLFRVPFPLSIVPLSLVDAALRQALV